jgi:hypothetical protein
MHTNQPPADARDDPLPRFFRPFTENGTPRCCTTCRHAIGWDSVHVYCQRAAIVPVFPCGHWEREAGCD